MAEYRSEPYLVGGLFTHGGDIERHYDYPPLGTNKAWDRGEKPWVRNPLTDEWMPVGATANDPRTCDWEGFLDEHGPAYDTPPGGCA